MPSGPTSPARKPSPPWTFSPIGNRDRRPLYCTPARHCTLARPGSRQACMITARGQWATAVAHPIGDRGRRTLQCTLVRPRSKRACMITAKGSVGNGGWPPDRHRIGWPTIRQAATPPANDPPGGNSARQRSARRQLRPPTIRQAITPPANDPTGGNSARQRSARRQLRPPTIRQAATRPATRACIDRCTKLLVFPSNQYIDHRSDHETHCCGSLSVLGYSNDRQSCPKS
jgi:hypothetical protein